jgi:hypothetical protein
MPTAADGHRIYVAGAVGGCVFHPNTYAGHEKAPDLAP